MAAKHGVFKRLTLLLAIIINIVNFVANWLLYADIVNIKPGLVFGPYPPAFNHTVLGFCILSSLVNILEVHSLYLELFRKDSSCWLSGNTTSAMSIWLDDIPKAGIMLYIVSCHDMAISVEEVVRACLLIATLIIRCLALLVRETCLRWRQSDGLPTREEIIYRRRSCRGCHLGFISIGLMLKLTAVLIIYFFTFFKTYKGGITYKEPSGILVAQPKVEQYINNASVFAQVKRGKDDWGWIEVLPMRTIIQHNDCSSRLVFDPDSTTVVSRCKQNAEIRRVINRSPLQAGQAPKKVQFKFRFLRPTKSLLLGNIEYTQSKEGLRAEEVSLRYFCRGSNRISKDSLGYMLGLVSQSEYNYNGTVTYSDSKQSIVTVPYCWRTGKMKCKMSGLLGPSLVRNFTNISR